LSWGRNNKNCIVMFYLKKDRSIRFLNHTISINGINRGIKRIIVILLEYYFKLFGKMPRVYLRVMISAERDLGLIPHFFNYYKTMGIKDFFVIIHAQNPESENIAKAVSLINELTKNLNVEISKWLGEPFVATVTQDKLDAIIGNLDKNAWIISADVDEFQEYPRGLKAVIKMCECLNYNYVAGRLIDRVSADHKLHPIKSDMPLWKQCPEKVILCDESVQCINKVVLHRKFIKLCTGNHFFKEATNGTAPREYILVIYVSHFKWFDNVILKIKTIKSWHGADDERDKRLTRAEQFFHLEEEKHNG